MIHKMTDGHLQQVVAIEERVFTSGWPKSEYEYELHDNPYASLYVVQKNNKVVGYFDLWVMYEKAEIANIAVHPDYMQKGYGQLMMDTLLKKSIEAGCETISLEVRMSNIAAIQLYKKNGFIEVNVRKNYYSDNGESAYLMVKPIGGLE